MSVVWEYIAEELEAETADLIGVGASQREYDNQWLYRTSRGLSEAGIDTKDYWIGINGCEARDYDITGNVFQQSFEQDFLGSEASILVAPRPSIYRGNGDHTYASNYTSMAGLVEESLDMVLMREVGQDINSNVFSTEKSGFSDYFPVLEDFKFPLEEIEPSDLANIVKRSTGLETIHIHSQRLDEEMILVR